MTIKPGDRLPDAKFTVMGADGPTAKTLNDVFSGKKVALFAVPGAYTPTCHKNHMPGFVDRVDEFKAKGIDTVACTAVNDIFVLTNWANDSGAAGKIEMLADGSGDFAKAIGLDIDLWASVWGCAPNAMRCSSTMAWSKPSTSRTVHLSWTSPARPICA